MSDTWDKINALMEELESIKNEFSKHASRFDKLVENITKLTGIVSEQHSGNMLFNEKMNNAIERIENLEKEQN